ncbi:putative RNA methyltransferase, nucleic acid-binding, alpha/beta knot methyltransferase [Heracleum sosnowskyi]|uniref:RNA methyltransferase, nucleic acid-binding, alpha/beta knot methyltransferase n=1 Tax=Heracleum sosnowskyi TaxID=360622 RepID=A0AAD8N578_9APIA|nr:putative RNA methyltransferase, nucleic acid-binding, alpha/beta knot methyltransferase [Heracleum sosnowskyi]
MAKKKRVDSEPDSQLNNQLQNEPSCVNGSNSDDKTHKKKKKKKHMEEKSIELKERPTVSIALPGSIIHNAQTLELATRLAGQIARAATIFRIEEIVVFDNKISSPGDSSFTLPDSSEENETGSAFLIRILNYLETPQYLRRTLCPWHNSLKLAGMLPPLDAPHHLRKHEWGTYREGVILKEAAAESGLSLADVGLNKNVVIDQVLEPGTRVTVAMGTNRQLDDKPRQVVSSSKPREEAGAYWGYKVRYAANISSVFQSCPYQGGYDHLIGTSEHGLFFKSSELTLPPFRHLLIAFGGLAGLEECFEEDKNLKGKKPSDVFHSYLNVCPNQGSRTIRTEEAVFISLQYFQEPIDRALQNV